MSRRAFRYGLLLVGGALSLAWCAPDLRPNTEPEKAKPTQAIRTKLAALVTLERGMDAGTPLRDALEFLSDRHDITIIVNTVAFGDQGIENVFEHHVQLPRIVGLRFSTILSMLAAQLKGTFLVHNDHVELTTFPHVQAENWARRPRENGLALAPMVDVEFDNRPLNDALRELADQSGINVVVDVRARQSAQTAITARLSHVPVDTAVRVLADMTDLKSLAIDNVIYVTSKPNAKVLEKELQQQRNGDTVD
jgi:hypothetical protein